MHYLYNFKSCKYVFFYVWPILRLNKHRFSEQYLLQYLFIGELVKGLQYIGNRVSFGMRCYFIALLEAKCNFPLTVNIFFCHVYRFSLIVSHLAVELTGFLSE